MNLSLLAHHDEWAKIHGSLSKLQKIDVKRHSCLSADLLSQSPGTDVAWISTVEQHHENFNGSGYPLGLKGNGILPEARVLRAADIWCALVLHPSGRGKKHPRQAIRELSDSDQRHIDPHVFNGLKKLMGAYPPGTLIRLLNRETALVVRWERKGIIPQSVLSIISPLGDTLNQFRIRSADQYGFGIRDYTHLNIAQLDRLPWRRILKAS
jgi:HD-GYP domain-containing protein (c-di-GMP phosphodiesterase class II)